MKKCERHDCDATFKAGQFGTHQRFCSGACRKAAFNARRGKERRRRGTEPTTGLGPATPLLGWTEEELYAYKMRRLAQLVDEGLPNDAIAERLGMESATVSNLSGRYRSTGKRRSPPLPFGLPA